MFFVCFVLYIISTGFSLAIYGTTEKYKSLAYPLAFTWFISIPCLLMCEKFKNNAE